MLILKGNKLAVLNYLQQGEFVSGEWLGLQLGISRAAVAKHIQSLQELGLDIFKVTGKGYRLNTAFELLNQQRIEQYYKAQSEGVAQFELFPVIDSTNSELMRRIQSGQLPDSGTVVVSESQTAGRGRRGRQWQSPFGSNLYFSYYWLLDDGLQAAMGVSIAVGLAVYDALKALYQIDVQLKWPNDILVHEQKLAGVLVELDGQPDGPCHLVIGIGLNLNMPVTASANIDQAWTDLALLGCEVDKSKLVAVLTHCLEQRLKQYRQSGLDEMHQQWNQVHAFQGQRVNLITGLRSWQGICEGIDPQGGIKIRQNGEVKSYFGGEISLRKVVDDFTY
ncbi:bifunctional biotin--[acetyl-CoA-carboxylase] ligase/biotin operon repressor BirA [Pseudoalteromonas tunicata]|jgi:BirA family biotin operon repressor/biotin-[acetyl-CoA-carboxylase] ligase|uniref:Bifunctional ligase/repressor BirA n=1 Tax=Pseudoalteromonas tunicata D2 TaxID=87626 RepID=A4CF99_9GAMM|nr:bifunctional biotin--[acetyl-CoA-carboxylase] ligase/biotin operon repressor BirA [Pseudoalteromonas tunicata]ATC96195.1 BirA family transcriptional regulator, biotin operon repressor / biotin-[acetyl-CoA-carboxylase] ligase [Pseudoalteromonas tunicata]AXT31713.1 bifunctional biotin--[acetyl-CoA-carboxylase] synthetase/biotin operon repressor [Pseudoalteromonas tunicata]EAR26647.1 hypothetical protein PTD2_00522 [Pseudoalteromonas tunicata D2]MDP4985584.1 bifunctional biotin--[acetyl-CoA-car